MAHLTKCPDCGCEDFDVAKPHIFSAKVDVRGVLVYGGSLLDFGVERITCARCGRLFDAGQFRDVEYC